MTTEEQSKARVVSTLEDVQTEIASDRWDSVYPMLATAADTARALRAKPVKLRPISTPPPPNGLRNAPRYSQSLERGLQILALFTSERPLWGVSDVADTFGWQRSTVHRYLLTLVSLGQLEQPEGQRRYRLRREDDEDGDDA